MKTIMTNSKVILSTLLAVGLVASTASFSRADDNSGGDTVDVNGKPTLEDLVDNTDCIWVSAADLSKTLPHFAVIEKNIKQENWYLEYKLEAEMQNLDVCETQSALVTVSTQDQDGVTIDTTESASGGSTQVGVRLNQEIYLSMPVFEKMTATDQAYLLLHETMHSFIPMNASQRNTRLRSFINAIQSLEQTPMSSQSFGLQMTNDQIDIPVLTSQQEQLAQSALDPVTPMLSRVAAANSLCSISYDTADHSQDHVFDDDQNRVHRNRVTCVIDEPVLHTTLKQAKTDFLSALETNQLDVLQKLVQEGKMNPIQYYLTTDLRSQVDLLTQNQNTTVKQYCSTFPSSGSTLCTLGKNAKDNLKNQSALLTFKPTFESETTEEGVVQTLVVFSSLQMSLLFGETSVANFIVAQKGDDGGLSMYLDFGTSVEAANSVQLANLLGNTELAQQIQAIWNQKNTSVPTPGAKQ